MANQIKMAVRDSIVTLYDKGWSQRRIAKALGVDRETVGRHIRLERPGGSNPAIPSTGIEATDTSNPAIPPTGILANPAIPPAGKFGRKSDCLPYHSVILGGKGKVERGVGYSAAKLDASPAPTVKSL